MKTKLISSLLGLAAFSLASISLAQQNYQIDSALSSVSFATTKKQYIIEPATIDQLSGRLDKAGHFAIQIDLANLDTANPTRDNSLRTIFFEATNYPTLSVKGQLDPGQLPAAGELKALTLNAELSLWNSAKTLTFEVLVANTGEQLLVSSRRPVIIKAADYGIPADNLTRLAATVNNIPLAPQAPINFNLVLSRAAPATAKK
ncbi:MAG: YceI family protein [Cellvibrionaceae bacterium]|nr:YceI family protein [Cellvibrionaceae bacterium]